MLTYEAMKKIALRYVKNANTCVDCGGCLSFYDDRARDATGGNTQITVYKDTGEAYPFNMAIISGKVTAETDILLDFETGEPLGEADAVRT